MSKQTNTDDLEEFGWILKYLSSALVAGLGGVFMFGGVFTMIDAHKKEQALLHQNHEKTHYHTYNVIDNGDTLYFTQEQWNLYREQRRQKSH